MNLKVTALAALLAMSASMQAALIDFQAGDLVLSVYAKGGVGATTNVSVSLGDAATSFRGNLDGTGVLGGSSYWTSSASDTWSFNTNLASTLSSQFGSDWATRTDLYWGISAVLTTSNTASPVDGDPRKTIYVSRPVDQGPYSGYPSASVGQAANWMNSFNTSLAGRDADAGQSLISTYSDTAPNSYESWQYGGANGGLADWQQFTTANANLSSALAVDRILGATGGNPGGTIGAGSTIGTFSVDSNGNLTFQAVPEPSTVALFVGAAVALGFTVWKRRRSAAALA